MQGAVRRLCRGHGVPRRLQQHQHECQQRTRQQRACQQRRSSAAASASASAKAAVCASVSKLKDDIVGLKDINIRANGTSAVSAQFTKIQQQFDVVRSDAHGQFSPQITNVSNALSTLGSSLTAARENLNTGTLATLAASVGAVVTTGNSLVSAVSTTC